MIKIENVEVMGWEHAIRGMRNPLNSWELSDSGYGCNKRNLWGRVDTGDKLCVNCSATYESHAVCSGERKYIIGPNDHKLMMSLAKGGPVHAKYRRMITVYFDVTAPLYFWKEFDTYKLGTVANSCSTMHKIHAKEFTMDDFSCEHLLPMSLANLNNTINILNIYRNTYLYGGDDLIDEWETVTYEPKNKQVWLQLIQLLPSSYNQKRTVMLNYEVLHNMYFSRKNHKLDEWREFCKWIETLPYSEIITTRENLGSVPD